MEPFFLWKNVICWYAGSESYDVVLVQSVCIT